MVYTTLNTPLSLYNKCLLTVINNENLPVHVLPKHILDEIGVIQSLHQKLTNKCIYYDMHWSTRDELNEIRDAARRCADCDWIYRYNYCDFHQLVTDYLRHKRDELLERSEEIAWAYWYEKKKVCDAFPKFVDLVEYMSYS